MTTHARIPGPLCLMVITLAGCGEPPPATETSEPPAGAAEAMAPGTTLAVRKLGGMGNEWGLGLASGADGAVIALSAIGGTRDRPDELGACGATAAMASLWSRSWLNHGGQVRVVDVARSPLGNQFLGLDILGSEAGIDLGGGPLWQAVVKLAPDGGFTWQREISGRTLTALAVDGHGAALVGTWGPFGGSVGKLRWDDVSLWGFGVPSYRGSWIPRVAVDPKEDVIVANGMDVYKLAGTDGARRWTVHLDAGGGIIDSVATTAAGTVVAAGRFVGYLDFAGTRLEEATEAGERPFLLAIEANGAPRWARARRFDGPVAVDPLGRIAFVEHVAAPCGDELVKWNLVGDELWRRPIARCPSGGTSSVHGRAVAIARTSDPAVQGDIWVQGDGTGTFDLGTGALTARASDWFLVRVAP